MDKKKYLTEKKKTEEDYFRRKTEEDHFRGLYDKIMCDFMEKTGVREKAISDAISDIKKAFSEGGRFKDINFNGLKFVCGYIYRFGHHGAGLTRFRILEALENCPDLRSILKKSHLRVVNLGGGPGNNAIGFCSAMSQSGFKGRLVIHVVDKAKLWQNCISMVRELLDKDDYGDTSHLFQQGKVALYFSPFTLPAELRYLAMYEFDVVLICKLISFMELADKRELIKKLYSTIEDSALILLIDCPSWDNLWAEKFEALYLSREGDKYCSGTAGGGRFGYNDSVTSKARIAVLRKKTPP